MKRTFLSLSVALALVISAPGTSNASSDGAFQTALQQVRAGKGTPVYELGILALQGLSDAGDSAASAKLGDILFHGSGVDDFEYGASYYERAIAQGDIAARSTLAAAYMQHGLNFGANTAPGRQYLSKAAELYRPLLDQDDGYALWNVGYMLATGYGLEKDFKEGVRLIGQAAEAGNTMACYWMATYLKQATVGREEAVERYLGMAAARGHVLARKMLETQRGVPQSAWALADSVPQSDLVVKALTTHISPESLVAQVGHTPPQPSLPPATMTVSAAGSTSALPSRTLELELATTRDQLLQANQLVQDLQTRLAARDAPEAAEAANLLGLNAVLADDYETALVKFRQAAALDFPPAISNLALLHLNGTAVPRDVRQAAALFKRAADLGNVTAAENLGRCYEYGIGLHRDLSRAIKWYERAAALGSQQAASSLAVLKARR